MGSSVPSSYPSATYTSTSYSSPSYPTQVPSRELMAAQLKEKQAAEARKQENLRKAIDLKQMLDSLEKVNDEGRRASLLDSLCSVTDVLSLPEHPNPPGTKKGNLVVDLLKHQVVTHAQQLIWCFIHLLRV